MILRDCELCINSFFISYTKKSTHMNYSLYFVWFRTPITVLCSGKLITVEAL